MQNGRLVLRVDGWLDRAGAHELAQICRDAPRPLCLHLEGLHDADREGLDVLAGLLDENLEICGLHPYVALRLDRHRATRAASSTIRVLIVDDDTLSRQLMLTSLETVPDIEVVGQAADGRQAVAQAEALSPDVVLMDLSMPIMDGVAATCAILDRQLPTRIVVLTGLDFGGEVVQAVRAGATGYLTKGCRLEEITEAVRAVHGGSSYLPATITRDLLSQWQRRQPEEALTDRETEIVRHVARGWKNQQIADHLFLSHATIRTHLGQIYEKLGLANRVELTLFALRDGLVTLEDGESVATP